MSPSALQRLEALERRLALLEAGGMRRRPVVVPGAAPGPTLPPRVSASEIEALTSSEVRLWAPTDMSSLASVIDGLEREAYVSGRTGNFTFTRPGKCLTWTLTGSVTITTATAFSAGAWLLVEFTQDGTGGHTVQLPTTPGSDWIVMGGPDAAVGANALPINPEAGSTTLVAFRCVDDTDGAEVVHCYVLPPQVTQAEAEAGTSTSPRIYTPQRVAQAIAALATGTPAGTEGQIVNYDATPAAAATDVDIAVPPGLAGWRSPLQGGWMPGPEGVTTMQSWGALASPVETGTKSRVNEFIRYASSTGTFGIQSSNGATDELPAFLWPCFTALVAASNTGGAGAQFFVGFHQANVAAANLVTAATGGQRFGLVLDRATAGHTTWHVVDDDGTNVSLTSAPDLDTDSTFVVQIWRDYTNPYQTGSPDFRCNVGWRLRAWKIAPYVGWDNGISMTPVVDFGPDTTYFDSSSGMKAVSIIGVRSSFTPEIFIGGATLTADVIGGFRTAA